MYLGNIIFAFKKEERKKKSETILKNNKPSTSQDLGFENQRFSSLINPKS